MESKLGLMEKLLFPYGSHFLLERMSILALIFLFANAISAQTLSLEKPTLAGAGFLEDEAGITAYMNAEQTIDLSLAKQAFRTIEEETDTYIIGSDSLPGYPETEDVHAYVNKDGWIVAYYLKQEPAAKIIDWNDYYTSKTIQRTKLEVAIMQIVDKAFIQPKEIKYYHFGYPNANRLMIVMDAMWQGEMEDSFDIKLPSGFTYGERSYLHFSTGVVTLSGPAKTWMYIDEQVISEQSPWNAWWNYGTVTPAQLSLDQFHKIRIKSATGLFRGNAIFGATVLIYQAP